MCGGCGHNVAKKTLALIRLPKVLVVQLKRFFFNQQRNFAGKIDRYVDFPTSLNMSRFVTDNDGEKNYQLSSVINHFGTSSSSGHYTTFSYTKGIGKWIHFNDSDCSAVSPRRVKTRAAYILMYVAGDVSEDSPSTASGTATRAPPSTPPPPVTPPRPSTPVTPTGNLSSLLAGFTVREEGQDSSQTSSPAQHHVPTGATASWQQRPSSRATLAPPRPRQVQRGRSRDPSAPQRRRHQRLERDEDGNPVPERPQGTDHTYGDEPARAHRRKLTPRQRSFIIKSFYMNRGKHTAIAAEWVQAYPRSGPAPTHRLVKRLILDFEGRGFDYKKGKGPEKTKVTDELVKQVTDVANGQTDWNNHKKRWSHRRNGLGVKRWNYQRAMKKAGMHPFKKKKKQKLMPGSHAKRLKMCRMLIRRNSRFFFWLVSVDGKTRKQKKFLPFLNERFSAANCTSSPIHYRSLFYKCDYVLGRDQPKGA